MDIFIYGLQSESWYHLSIVNLMVWTRADISWSRWWHVCSQHRHKINDISNCHSRVEAACLRLTLLILVLLSWCRSSAVWESRFVSGNTDSHVWGEILLPTTQSAWLGNIFTSLSFLLIIMSHVIELLHFSFLNDAVSRYILYFILIHRK